MFLQTIINACPAMLHASWMTIQVSVCSILVGQLFGLPLAIARVSAPLGWVKITIDVYVSFFRGVPLLVKILLVYYFLPAVGINVPPVASAVVALGLASSAYVEEIYRATISDIAKGQFEAAQMLQLSRFTIWFRIIYPQALKSSVPALASEVISLVKASALVSVVGIAELTSTTQNIASQNFRPLEMYLMAAFLYLAFTGVISLGASQLERHLQAGCK